LGPKKIDIEMIDSMKQIKQKIIICYTKSDKKIKEKSAFLDNLNTEFENYIVSSKTNENIFEIQKKIFEFL
jgi:GTP-binding protein EngB required for normal cell division